MAQIDHPNGEGSIDVAIIDSESHRGNDMVQVEATDEDTELSDQSGEQPWLWAEEVTED